MAFIIRLIDRPEAASRIIVCFKRIKYEKTKGRSDNNDPVRLFNTAQVKLSVTCSLRLRGRKQRLKMCFSYSRLSFQELFEGLN